MLIVAFFVNTKFEPRPKLFKPRPFTALLFTVLTFIPETLLPYIIFDAPPLPPPPPDEPPPPEEPPPPDDPPANRLNVTEVELDVFPAKSIWYIDTVLELFVPVLNKIFVENVPLEQTTVVGFTTKSVFEKYSVAPDSHVPENAAEIDVTVLLALGESILGVDIEVSTVIFLVSARFETGTKFVIAFKAVSAMVPDIDKMVKAETLSPS